VRPGHAETLCNLGRALETLGRLAEAVDSHQAAITERPDFARAHVELGNVLQVKGENALSEVAYRQALDVEPSFVAAFAGLADLYEKTSRLDEADRAASEVIDREPDNVLANVVAAKCARRRGRPEAGLDRLRSLDHGNLDTPAKSAVCFEMGRLLDRLGDADEAYSCFVEGNRLNAEHARIGADEKESYPRLVRQLADTFTENWVNSWTPPVAETRPAPIFLIGFPRSGTTLLDQVLDSHPRLVTLEERPTVDAVVAEVAAMAGGYPGALATLSSEQINRLRELYFGVVDNHLESPLGDAVLVDKMPLNTVDAGLIHRLFPSARFILSLRHPCDVVLSGFMQAFRPNPAMARFSTLADTASLYGQVMDLWGRYVDVLRLVALPVRYENLVTDLEGEARRVLAFLDLEWDDAVLDYADRAREKSIATPSYHQVVQPIYKSSVGRWTQYRPQLEPVLPILRPACEMFGYALADRS